MWSIVGSQPQRQVYPTSAAARFLTSTGLYQFIEKRKRANTMSELAGDDGLIHCVFICCDLPYQYINEYFTKLGPQHFHPIQNQVSSQRRSTLPCAGSTLCGSSTHDFQNLTAVDLYRYDEAWERDAADIIASAYDATTEQCNSTPKLALACERLHNITTPRAKLKPATLLVDLRRAEDFALWHLPEAVNVPLQSLDSTTPSPFYDPATLERQWLELESLFPREEAEDGKLGVPSLRGRRVYLLCYDGDTSRIATSILRAKGVEADSIRGGLRAMLPLWPDLQAGKQNAMGDIGFPWAALTDSARSNRAVA